MSAGARAPEARPSFELRSYGRRRGRKLSPRQEALLSSALPKVSVDLSRPAPSPLTSLFEPNVTDLWLEIGFGGGEHLVQQAEDHCSVGMIGCEPFIDGVVKTLTAIDERGRRNIRVHADDARPLLRWLPSGSIGRAFILFPDPWPKRRHAKRRLVSAETLALLARVLRPGGELRIATDVAAYASAILLTAKGQPAFAWLAAGPADWRARTPDWPATKYEKKAIAAGRRCYYFRFRRG